MYIRAQNSPNPVTQRIQELMKGHTDRTEEAEIISLLETADKVTLNDTLTDLDLNDLFGDVDDRWRGPKNKTKLLNMLSQDRLVDVEVPARAAIVEGLAKGWTSKNAEDEGPMSGGIEERSIRNVFVGTEGAQLTELKNAVNAGADHYDMHGVLFHDVDDPALVQEMFTHFATQAPEATDVLKPLSDIDDTFYSSLKDKRYPSKTVYPGVLAFYDELDRGPNEQSPDPLGDLTYLTARPGEFTGIVKDSTHKSLRERGVKEAAILVGSLTGLINHERMAAKKFENFEQYAQIFPEYSFSWLGDSGQGDAILGEKMMNAYSDRVKGAFIHDVVATPAEERAAMKEKGIHYFDTYTGAAVEAYELGLISAEGLQRVADATQADLAAIEGWKNPEQQADRQRELQLDLERVRKALDH